MRAYLRPALVALVLTVLAAGCAPNYRTSSGGFASCDGRPRVNLLGLNSIYQPVATDTCQLAILPSDLSSWIEAPLNSHRQRNLKRIVMGCTNLTPEAADCNYGGLLGHSVATLMDFNMATYPEDARVQKAVLALHVQNNIPFFAQTVQIRGRMMTGDVLQSIGQYPILPSVQPGWILFDVTAIAARAINERRPALHIEVSLPCGRSDSELTIMSLTEAEPRLIVEFR